MENKINEVQLDSSELELFQLVDKSKIDRTKVESLDNESVSFWKKARKKFLNHKPSIVWLTVLIILILMSILVPIFSKYGINQQNLKEVNELPSLTHFFGTDANGEDIFVRVWYGLGMSMLVGLFVMLLSFFIGLPIGLIQGYFGGKVDDIILGIEQIIQSIPDLILFIVLLLAFGRSPVTFVIALSTYMWIGTAIQSRANAIQQKNLEYVLVSKTLGTGNTKVIFKHILPNIIARQIIEVSTLIPAAIMYESFLSFLGIGIDQNKIVTLGGLLSEVGKLLLTYPYQIIFPASVLVIFVLAVNFIAMGLQYALDEKL